MGRNSIDVYARHKAIENKDTIMLANPSNSKIRTTEKKHLTFQSRKPT